MKTITVRCLAVIAAVALVAPALADDLGSPAPMGEGIPAMESPAPLGDPPLPEPSKTPIRKKVIETESLEIEVNSPTPMDDPPLPTTVIKAEPESPAPFDGDEPSVLPGTIDLGDGVLDTVVEHEEVRVEYRGRGRPDRSGYTPLVRKTLYRGKKAPTLRHVRSRLQSAGISTVAFDRKLAQFREEWRKQVRLNRSAIRALRSEVEELENADSDIRGSISRLIERVDNLEARLLGPTAQKPETVGSGWWQLGVAVAIILIILAIVAAIGKSRNWF